MILQELLRNIVLYRGVLKPFFHSWSDTISTHYLKRHSSVSSLKISSAKFEAKKVFLLVTLGNHETTGTCTMSYLSLRNVSKSKTGNDVGIPLVVIGAYENTVKTAKTYSQSFLSESILPITVLTRKNERTTGFATERSYTFLITETHEKRESLGGFPLTRDETHLMFYKRGGELI